MLLSVVMVAMTDTLAVMRNARNTSAKEKNMSGKKSWRSAKRHERWTAMTASSIGGKTMGNEPKKYCPLNASTGEVLICCQKRCAWWDEDAQECALLVIAKALKKRK